MWQKKHREKKENLIVLNFLKLKLLKNKIT